jgi:cytochrome c
MDSFELNKIAGAVLGTGLLVFGLKIVGGAMFAGEIPQKPGFMIATAEAQTADAKPAEGGAPAASLGALLAKADKASGESKAKACLACHDFSKGGANKVGPALYDVVGRKIASVDGFAYSDGLKAMNGKVWGYAELDGWIKSPKAMVGGTKMAFGGVANDQARADLLAYLGSLSDAPKPFPAP